MGFFSGLCCSSRSLEPHADDTAGSYIRVVDTANLASSAHNPYRRRNAISIPVARPNSHTHALLEKTSELTQPLITIDEKDPADFESPSPSPYSSVVSIPSTRVTDLTSSYTGSTNPRNSRGYVSPPPSYHSDRSRSPSPQPPPSRGEQQQHPVMSVDWLEILQRGVERERAPAKQSLSPG